MEDADGNTLAVGYKGMLMFVITSITLGPNPVITWQGGLDGTENVTTKDGANAHKGQGNWPGVPA